MKLEKAFLKLRPSIVALGSKAVVTKTGKPPTLPGIIGTGFVLQSDGIVVTNRHVAEALRELPRHPKANESAAFALVFTKIQKEQEGLGMGAHSTSTAFICFLNSAGPMTTTATGCPI